MSRKIETAQVLDRRESKKKREKRYKDWRKIWRVVEKNESDRGNQKKKVDSLYPTATFRLESEAGD